VDVITGVGLDDALAGIDVVVDVINSPAPDDSSEAFFEASSANLAAAAARARVDHHVVLSIVGADRLAPVAGYMRGKLAQETAAATSGVPWTVVRSTQFHELTESITGSLVDGDEVHVPVASIQPIASGELAAILTRVATAEPLNAIHEVAGPERMSFADMARTVVAHQQRDVAVLEDASATYFGLPVDHATLVPAGSVEAGSTTLAAWLAQR
jgi:uncharacterized protein YbjT (DUF2867 family)